MQNLKRVPTLLAACLLLLSGAWAQTAKREAPDLTKQPTLYVVPYAHLDTQWRWDYPTTINEYIPNTMHENFALFEKYPHYIFNFSGANRYRMMKEYYPGDYEKVKKYVAAGRWFPSGSSMEENDVNSPNAESVIRQILYGTEFFRHEFGKTSAEYMLPDCFGFPASLPSILAHAGLKGFSTQKLSWRSANGIPFPVGFWEGPDGRGVIAALNAGDYNGDVRSDWSNSSSLLKRIEETGRKSGLLVDFQYYGVGDVGGSPREPSVKVMEAILTKGKALLPPPGLRQQGQAQQPAEVQVGEGPIHVIQASAEQMFLDITPDAAKRLPRYKGDLELIEHSAGSLSSEAFLKRWNRRNEVLADAAERASVAAHWLGARQYPLARLNDAWTLVMGGQFHDIIPGTSLPKAYEYSWNDEVLAMNQFAGVLTSATEAVASALNTQAKGTAVVVYNPLNIAREDVVEASVRFPGGMPKGVKVFGPDGKEVPAQVNGEKNGAAQVLFLAKVPSVGYAAYDVQPAEMLSSNVALRVSQSSLENSRYAIKLDDNGDVTSIFDKTLNKELLSSPLRLAFQTEKPHDWPAWNMDWADQQKPPRGYVSGPAQIRVVEGGPVRVAVEVSRESEGSKFMQTVRLSTGDAGNRVEIANAIDWHTPEAALKATFPLTASNALATYNWDIGTIQRGNNVENKFEVASHQWFDLTDKSGAYGVTVLTDCKNGSDKPNDNTVRLTLLYTPGINPGGNGREYSDQASQDWGHHEFVYGLAAHAGDWRQGQTDWQALRVNEPLVAFQSAKHLGRLGKAFSLMNVSDSRVRVMALKKAEQSDEVIVRLVEIDGKKAPNVKVSFAGPVVAAREVNGQEQPVGPATVTAGELVTEFGPYQPRTFALKLAAPASKVAAAVSTPVSLPYDRMVTSGDQTHSSRGFDAQGQAIPAEMLPSEIPYAGIRFKLAAGDKPNAVVAKGQTIDLPAGRRVYILAAAAEGDQPATFKVGNKAVDLSIQDWMGYVGQWDARSFVQKQVQMAVRGPRPANAAQTGAAAVMQMEPVTIDAFAGLTPGYIKPAPVAWFASHRHTSDGKNEAYQYSYLYAYSIPLPANTKTLTLPDNDKIRVLAITVSNEAAQVEAAQPLYDTYPAAERPAAAVTAAAAAAGR